MKYTVITDGNLLQLPAIAIAIAKTVLFWSCYFLVFFSNHRFFDVPGPIFAKLCHTTRCILKYFITYMGVHSSYVSPKNLRGENPHFLAIFGPKIDTLSPAIA